MAAHCGVAVIPARARKPQNKAKVEAGVLIAERWIMARLRQRSFFSLGKLNLAISKATALFMKTYESHATSPSQDSRRHISRHINRRRARETR
jgi:transposase